MNYPKKVYIQSEYCNKENAIKEDTNCIKVGNVPGSDWRLGKEDFDVEFQFVINIEDEYYELIATQGVYILSENGTKSYSARLELGKSVKVFDEKNFEYVLTIGLRINFDEESTIFDTFIELDQAENNTIKVDYNEGSPLYFISDANKNSSVIFKYEKDKLLCDIICSDFEWFLNGTEIKEKRFYLYSYDFVRIADSEFMYKKGRLYFDSRKIKCNIDSVNCLSNSLFNYPKFIRNNRLYSTINTDSIKILDPSELGEKPKLNLLTSLMPAIIMLVLCVVFRGIMGNGGAFVIFSICSMGMGLVTSIINLVKGQKEYKKSTAKRNLTYKNYIEDKRKEISVARQNELEALNSIYFSTKQDIDNIINFSTTLFDRNSNDDDFLSVYLGIGKRKALKQIEVKEQEKLEEGDELSKTPALLREKYEYINNSPIITSLLGVNAIGVVGEKNDLFSMFKNMVIDLCSRQYYSDVKLFCFLPEKEQKKYEFLKYIPHFNSDYFRNIVCDTQSRALIFDYLFKEMSARNKDNQGTNIVILVMDEWGIKSHPISQFIEDANEKGVSFIFFEEKKEYLPQYLKTVIELSGNGKGCCYESNNTQEKEEFSFEETPDSVMKEVAIKLSPIYCEEVSLDSELRKSISLFEMLNIYDVDDLNLSDRYSKSCIYKTMAVPIGINAKNTLVNLDLHEKYHGPHGLVAGTTGSGKSEVLQTYILSMAVSFHPYEVGFVIIDFKGGGMVNQFRNLHHLIGAITNIDGKEIDRSLQSIKAELLKRQECFAEAEVNHIDKYIALYKEGKVEKPLPHLIIIVDEFAELKAEQPEFMKELISAARIGRSLGVHLILATQKPAGQVNEQIWSNSKFKICLKVQTMQDSNEVLKSPLAAEIKEPGRAYLQVGNNEIFELFQSAYSGAPEHENNNEKAFSVTEVDFKGYKKIVYKKEHSKGENSRNQLDAIVEKVSRFCSENGIEKLDPICQPSLESKLDFVEDTIDKNEGTIIIGVLDDPAHQRKREAKFSVEENTMIVGSAQMGKTNLLMTIIRQVCSKMTAQEVNIYILDFASMILKNFESLKHVGGVVCASDEEKMTNTIKFLASEIGSRRNQLLKAGVSSFKSYLEMGGVDIPRIIVLLDNFVMFKELYSDEADIINNFLREGPTLGITFIVTNSSTNGISFKYMANFQNNIAFYLNDSSTYTALYGAKKVIPDEIPGRCVILEDKEVYETQVYCAFEGEKEFQRIKNISEWIKDANSVNETFSAKKIPEIPVNFIYSEYVNDKNELRIGLDYDDVADVVLEPAEVNDITIVGKQHFGMHNFIKLMINEVKRCNSEAKIILFDDYKGYFRNNEDITDYYFTRDEMLEDWKEMYVKYLENSEISNEGSVKYLIILNNIDLLNLIIDNKEAISIYKDIIVRLKRNGVYFVNSCMENEAIGFNADDIRKHTKDCRHVILFDDISNIKLLENPMSFNRKAKKQVTIGDAYYFKGKLMKRIKIPWVQ
ncbi:MAG: type VII secretion protein EssC [Lachnospiraceae bacterium]|nr:type VII secretion protein EssC [Lachnospiraceae bacterium]